MIFGIGIFVRYREGEFRFLLKILDCSTAVSVRSVQLFFSVEGDRSGIIAFFQYIVENDIGFWIIRTTIWVEVYPFDVPRIQIVYFFLCRFHSVDAEKYLLVEIGGCGVLNIRFYSGYHQRCQGAVSVVCVA